MVDLRAEAEKQDWIVRMQDSLAAGFCARKGAMAFLAVHGIDTRDALRNGLSARRLLAFNDAQVDRVVLASWMRRNG